MTRKVYYPVGWHWRRMPTVAFTQNPPVQNTSYNVLTARNIRIKTILVKQVNTDLAAKSITFMGTLDHTLSSNAVSFANNEVDYCYLAAYPSTGDFFRSIVTPNRSAGYVTLDAKNVALNIRMTSVPGANQELYCWVQYEQKVKVS